MKILHISTHDIAGGAARAAYGLHRGLRGLEIDSAMFASGKTSTDGAVSQFVPPKGKIQRIYRLIRKLLWEANFLRYAAKRPEGYELFSNDLSFYGKSPVQQLPDSDIVNLHWIAGFIEYNNFFTTVLPQRKIVWTFHDMNPFTGGCHYDMGCDRYMEGCGRCPQLGSKKINDLSSKIWLRKKRLFSSLDPGRMHLVAPNKWMKQEIEKSPLLNKFPVSVIPYGVDCSVYKPRDRKIAREFLGLRQNSRIVLFVSASLTNKRKGFGMLDMALNRLGDSPDIVFLSVGSARPKVHSKLMNIHLGHIDNDYMLSQIYNAVDVFVIPSIQDNLPNTVLESIACGTPVVGFDVGGIPDMVRPGLTGLLVKPGDIKELSNAIEGLLENKDLRESISSNCRKAAENEYSLEIQAKRYQALYKKLLSNGP